MLLDAPEEEFGNCLGAAQEKRTAAQAQIAALDGIPARTLSFDCPFSAAHCAQLGQVLAM
ncbi:hypothetical protein ISN76_14070 [Dyella halodurans]|uniref:Uncharacterized protein n=1 Tax=Dyella halodurans TaxID=1920171 RepID=A0ABV9C4Y2_9GAMM|nr:hypothetical protein [Dyella halodurans]